MMDKDTMLQDNDTLIVHLCPRGAWEAALVSGAFHTTSLDEEGFIHCSRRNQILAVANTLSKIYRMQCCCGSTQSE